VLCQHGTTIFLLGPSMARVTAACLRAVPAQARLSRCDYFGPYENTILLWYEWWWTQFHTCKVDFVIYFYVISYIRLYNAYNACYQEGITYRFANWPFSCRASPSTTQNVSCCAVHRSKILGTTRPSHSCRAGKAQNYHVVPCSGSCQNVVLRAAHK
jgi:hypothetical protein